MLKNLESAKLAYKPMPKTGEIRPCVNCGKPFYLTKTMIKRDAKNCSRVCYRAWNAARFDRHIGQVESVSELTGFDEYLSSTKLRCLFDDCEWIGDHLGLHVNLTHGVTADKLKELVGFNKGTGLISGDLARTLQRREYLTMANPKKARDKVTNPGGEGILRKEGREHYEKSMFLLELKRLVSSKGSK